MTEYVFTLRYRVPLEVSPDALVERLGEAGLTDALAGLGVAGRLGLEFSREAATGSAAVSTAVGDVSRCLKDAVLIEACPDYVGMTDIAEHMSLSRQAVRKIMIANGSFPAPVHDGSTALWHLSDVLEWFAANRQHAVDPAVLDVACAARALNAEIESAKILGAAATHQRSPATKRTGADDSMRAAAEGVPDPRRVVASRTA